jgi:hypothetical protein
MLPTSRNPPNLFTQTLDCRCSLPEALRLLDESATASQQSASLLKKSDTFVVDPVKVFFVPEVQQRDINPADQAKLEDYFTKAIRNELQAGRYNLVSEPGSGVKALRFAITNVEPNRGKTNAAVAGTTAVATHAVAPGVGELVPRLKSLNRSRDWARNFRQRLDKAHAS